MFGLYWGYIGITEKKIETTIMLSNCMYANCFGKCPHMAHTSLDRPFEKFRCYLAGKGSFKKGEPYKRSYLRKSHRHECSNILNLVPA